MSCGAYHTLITIGETQFGFNKFNLEVVKMLLQRINPKKDFEIFDLRNLKGEELTLDDIKEKKSEFGFKLISKN